MAAVPADVKEDQQIGEWIDGLQCSLRHKLASTEDAEDIAQEACLKLMQLPTTGNIQNPRAYLYRVAHNLVYDHYRRKPLIVERIEIDLIEDPYASPEAQTIVQSRSGEL